MVDFDLFPNKLDGYLFAWLRGYWARIEHRISCRRLAISLRLFMITGYNSLLNLLTNCWVDDIFCRLRILLWGYYSSEILIVGSHQKCLVILINWIDDLRVGVWCHDLTLGGALCRREAKYMLVRLLKLHLLLTFVREEFFVQVQLLFGFSQSATHWNLKYLLSLILFECRD